jgi:hypothetical protein
MGARGGRSGRQRLQLDAIRELRAPLPGTEPGGVPVPRTHLLQVWTYSDLG